MMKFRSSVYDSLKNKVPAKYEMLVDMAFNISWSWHTEMRGVFKYIDRPLWHSNGHNAIKILKLVSQERLDELTSDENFENLYLEAIAEYTRYEQNSSWFGNEFPDQKEKTIAYLSMEYGIHASLPIYSGGLGILSGDHLKESSDLGIPLHAVGFLYQEGYFNQRITDSGWQEAIFRENDFEDMPLFEMMDPANETKPLIIPIDFNDIVVSLKIWLLRVGKVNLYLMDSNIDQNPPWDRDLTDRLYGGSSEQRLKQEKMLGIGAVRIFQKLGITPDVWHLNEGHCSFSALERIRLLMNEGQNFQDALTQVRKNTVFTTHTPVPAGHDVFPIEMVRRYFEKIYIQTLGEKNFFDLGTYSMGEGHESGYNMTALGMRTSKLFNGVAKLHGQVSEEMFTPLWQELKTKWGDDFVPLTYVTNGVHVPSFINTNTKSHFDSLSEDWIDHHDDPNLWKDDSPLMSQLNDEYLWNLHLHGKTELIAMIRELNREKRTQREWNSEKSFSSGVLLDPEALTLGFARRFATYKRATLIFSDMERLKRIMTDPHRPVQIIFAGKAHPADDPGKQFIQEIVRHSLDSDLQYRIAFIENYDLIIAKRMLHGVDVWLNNPLRPNEASGTSGMKAAINLIPNLSILDGWWAEGYDGKNGWAINPENKTFENPQQQDWQDAQSLYDLLEHEIIPAYYKNRNAQGVPLDFVPTMKNAMTSAMPNFCARRMLKQYSQNLYVPLM